MPVGVNVLIMLLLYYFWAAVVKQSCFIVKLWFWETNEARIGVRMNHKKGVSLVHFWINMHIIYAHTKLLWT